MVVFPNIKINLGLEILRKRPDGYHDIATVMVGVDWCDVLEVVPATGETDSLVTTGLSVACPPEKNLVMKALRAVRQSCGVKVPPVDVFLHKNVPDGAGLGGGSSDAAYMIIALNRLFNLGLIDEEMARIAAGIGCDCPFFIYNVPMFATDRGDILTPVAGLDRILRDYKVVVVKADDVAVSTPEAYAGVIPCEKNVRPTEIICLPVDDWKGRLINDFEKSIFAKTTRPELIKAAMYDLGASYASMSGSGSAVFGIFRKDLAESTDFPAIFPDCAIHEGEFILK